MLKKITLLMLIMVFAFSCSIEKRKYQPGYNIQWKHKVKEAAEGSHSEKFVNNASQSDTEKSLVLQNNNTDTFNLANKEQLVDTEILLNGSLPKKNIQQKIAALHADTKKSVNRKETNSFTNKQNKNSISDSFLFSLAGLMFVFVLGFQKLFRKFGTKMTRWAKSNPNKSIGIIALLHSLVIGMGWYSGYSMNKMGIEISNSTLFIFGGIMILGFLVTPFIHRKTQITTPSKVNFNRAAFAGILITSMMLAAGNGNRMVKNNPDSKFIQVFEKTDHFLGFSNDSSRFGNHSSINQQEEFENRKGHLLATSGATIGFIILMSFLICVGICAAALGLGMLISIAIGSAGFAALLGIPLIGLGILIVISCARAIQNR